MVPDCKAELIEIPVIIILLFGWSIILKLVGLLIIFHLDFFFFLTTNKSAGLVSVEKQINRKKTQLQITGQFYFHPISVISGAVFYTFLKF